MIEWPFDPSRNIFSKAAGTIIAIRPFSQLAGVDNTCNWPLIATNQLPAKFRQLRPVEAGKLLI